MAAKIKKGDTVVVIAGRDKGTTGEVLKVIPDENRVVVRGVNVVKRHQKPSQVDAGGLKSFEGSRLERGAHRSARRQGCPRGFQNRRAWPQDALCQTLWGIHRCLRHTNPV